MKPLKPHPPTSQGRKGNQVSPIFAKCSSCYFTFLNLALKHLGVFSCWNYLAKSVHICKQSWDDSNHTGSSTGGFLLVFLPVLLRAALEVTVHSEPFAHKCDAAYVLSNKPYLKLPLLAFRLQLYYFQTFIVALLDPSGILHNPPKLCQTQIICITSKFYYKIVHPPRLWIIYGTLAPAGVLGACSY